ncbi:hypothetical protein HAX54_025036 [Datura stramonium]|uniref:Uncharacterized protein n=1 Tax=Datura stramonium TaxID=4076 RepID=A0ABS8V020_DATST|nr:hypothetical protein [Datura stramonium]
MSNSHHLFHFFTTTSRRRHCLEVLKDSNAVKESLDQLVEVGWAKKWSSQPYVMSNDISRELTTLGIKNAENLAIPSVRNDIDKLIICDWIGVSSAPYLIGSISLVVLGIEVLPRAGKTDLQWPARLKELDRSKPSLSKDQQQNLTRWAVLFAASLLKNNSTLHEALITAMTNKASVVECIEAIIKAADLSP